MEEATGDGKEWGWGSVMSRSTPVSWAGEPDCGCARVQVTASHHLAGILPQATRQIIEDYVARGDGGLTYALMCAASGLTAEVAPAPDPGPEQRAQDVAESAAGGVGHRIAAEERRSRTYLNITPLSIVPAFDSAVLWQSLALGLYSCVLVGWYVWDILAVCTTCASGAAPRPPCADHPLLGETVGLR